MINAMTFYDKKHLITCAEDGKVCILKTGTWNVEKTLLKHTQGVIDVAVHPSGKINVTRLSKIVEILKIPIQNFY